MGRGQGWFGFRRDSSGGTSQVPQFPDDPDEPLCGVGVVLFKAPDDSLFVKALVEGSSACNSGILPGDCLMEVNGKNVYCKGIELATKAILGKEGSVVTLKLIRIDRGKRIPISASLVREMKATAHPEFSVKSSHGDQFSSSVSTSQVFLECLQQERKDDAFPDSDEAGAEDSRRPPYGMPTVPREAPGEDFCEDADEDCAGVFASSRSRSMSGSHSTSRASSAAESGGGRAASNDSGSVQGRAGVAERKVKYKGRWYTESEIAALELKAQQVRLDMDRVASGVSSPRLAAGPRMDGCSVERRDQRLVVGPSLVDLGRGPKPLSQKELSLNSDPEALKAAIVVVEGMKLEKVSNRKIVGKVLKAVYLKMSTCGVLTWGKGKEGHVMWVRPQKDLYDPSMSKREFAMLQRRFFVMLEGDQVMAHSSQGGTIRACEAAAALEFVASSREERDTWVTGINMVLGMAKKEALERETKNRMKEVHAAASQVPSVFITAVPGTKKGFSSDSTAHEDSIACGDEESTDAIAFGSKEQRESVRRAADRGRKGWGGKIAVPAPVVRGASAEQANDRCRSHACSVAASHDADNLPRSELSSKITQPDVIGGSASDESSNQAHRRSASCAATCWPPVSPGNANKKKGTFSLSPEGVMSGEMSSSEGEPLPPALLDVGSSSDGHSTTRPMKACDAPPVPCIVPDDHAPSSILGLEQQSSYKGKQTFDLCPAPVVKVPSPQPSSGGSEILSEMTTAEDTPRVGVAADVFASAPAADVAAFASASADKDRSVLQGASGGVGGEPAYQNSSQATAGGGQDVLSRTRQVASGLPRQGPGGGALLPKLMTSAPCNASLPDAPSEHRSAGPARQSQIGASERASHPAEAFKLALVPAAAHGSGTPVPEPGSDAPEVLAASQTSTRGLSGALTPGSEAGGTGPEHPNKGASAGRSSVSNARPRDCPLMEAAAASSARANVAPADSLRADAQPEENQVQEVQSGSWQSAPSGSRRLLTQHMSQDKDENLKPAPGRVAAPKKQDFAALMAARQKKMREAEEADEGLYFD